MNNSFLAIENNKLNLEEEVSQIPHLQEEEAKMVRLIGALQEVQKSKHWRSLKTELFDGITTALEKELQREAEKEDPDPLKQNRLAGQLLWARKYSKLEDLEQVFKVKLAQLRKQLHGKEIPG